MTHTDAAKLRRAILGLLVMVIFLVGYVTWRDYDREEAQVGRDRATCLASKKTSRLLADSWQAHREYLLEVLAAPSVKDDVKKAARKANLTHVSTIAQLRKRQGRNCVAEYPAATLLPF